jgi:hypothetical protein
LILEETPLERIRKLEAERQRLKEQALAKVHEAIAELGEMGLIYELHERKKKAKKKEPPSGLNPNAQQHKTDAAAE